MREESRSPGIENEVSGQDSRVQEDCHEKGRVQGK